MRNSSYRLCRYGYSTRISARHSGCGLTRLNLPARPAEIGVLLRRLHRVQHRIEQIQRQDNRSVVESDRRPAAARRAPCVRVDLADRAGCGFTRYISTYARSRSLARSMGPERGPSGAASAKIGLDEHDLGADLARGSDGFGERIGGLDRDVDELIFASRPRRG